MRTKKPTPRTYTVGWISALPIEHAPATAMLDEIFDDELTISRSARDENTYVFGRIGPHNIVITNLPAGVYGQTPVTVAAMNLLSTFPDMEYGLLVGIGGAVPSPKHDIRLGDVVVSKPLNGLPGVVQFDRGKAMEGMGFQQTGFLQPPPRVLLKTAELLEKEYMLGGTRIPGLIADMYEENEGMKEEYCYQGVENDLLFESGYAHVDDEDDDDKDDDCKSCNKARVIPRPARKSSLPVIHHGTIGSSNQVIKDSRLRDALGEAHSVICLEMEAAALMDVFPAMVIRGICDYSDSHKNKHWQRYAAAVAAAYAKELLLKVPVAGAVNGRGKQDKRHRRDGGSCIIQ